PVWEGPDRISQEGGLALMSGYGDDRVRVQQADSYAPYVSHSGAFRVTAGSFQQYRTVDLSSLPRNSAPGARRSESLTFSFTVWAEPKLPIMAVGEAKVTAAADNDGRSMMPDGVGGEAVDGPVIPGRRVVRLRRRRPPPRP